MKYTLIPYKGLGKLCLYESYDKVLSVLDETGIDYSIAVQDNSECTVNYNWRIVSINGCIRLFFSEGNYKLFKICATEGTEISLPNGIYAGMKLEDALKLDSSLQFDEWDEIYISAEGYYLEDSLETEKVVSINVHVKEIDDADFDYCRW
ncbi:MAG: hypothetical protein Q4B60_08975 [Erysipelotrichaceae bacterium]|nr:hypothetical protein [Erysipelotrichaceae bacterium]